MKKDTMITALARLFITTSEDTARKGIVLGALAIIAGLMGGFYYIKTNTTAYTKAIIQARSLASKTDELISAYNAVTQEEDNLADLLAKKTDYTGLKSYFERFCQSQKVTPEPGWAETTEVKEITGSERFEEEQLSVQFKKITLKDLVQCIDALEKDDLLHLKELDIEKSDGSLTAKMAIAAKRFKRTVEE